MDEKKQENERVKEKFQQLMTDKLGNLNKNMNSQDHKFKT